MRSQPDKVKSSVKLHHPTISQPQQMSSAPFREVSSRLSPSYRRADREETNEWGATGEVSFMKCTCVLPGLLSLSLLALPADHRGEVRRHSLHVRILKYAAGLNYLLARAPLQNCYLARQVCVRHLVRPKCESWIKGGENEGSKPSRESQGGI